MEQIAAWVATDSYMPHGQCILWRPGLLWLHVVSDALIWGAYLTIPVILVYFVKKRRDVPFPGIFFLFGAFIVACGTTHLMEVWTIWKPNYWVSGLIKAMTAAVSWATVVQLIPVIPQALALRSPAELETINAKLEREIAERAQAEERLAQRARDLARANTELESFNRLAVGREQRMIELKQQVNQLLQEAGKPPAYNIFLGLEDSRSK